MSRMPKHLGQQLSFRGLIEVVIAGLAVYIVLAGVSGLEDSWEAVRSADAGWLALTILVIIASYVCATLTYMLLSVKKLRFVPTLWVELSGCLINRLLPGGLGGLGLNVLYLQKRGHNLTAATLTVACNNLLGFVGNALLLTGVLAFIPVPMPTFLTDDRSPPPLLIAAVFVLVLAAVSAWKRTLIESIAKNTFSYGKLLLKRPVRTVGALLSSTCLTALHATGLFLVLLAIHHPVSWPLALIAVSAGSLAGGLVPTPGGLGGAEAGIAAMLIGLSVPAAAATAAALIYRAITYWLPLLPGYLAFRVAEKRYL